VQDSQIALGQEQAAYETGVRMEKLARRGSMFAARIPPLYYQVTDFMRMDLPASHQEIVADETAHGGQGSLVGQDQPFDAEMLARMHAAQAGRSDPADLPGAGTDPYVMAETAFVQGIMALDRRDYAAAAAQLQTANSLLTQNPSQMLNFVTRPVCYLGLALEYTGIPSRRTPTSPRAVISWIATASRRILPITAAIGPRPGRITRRQWLWRPHCPSL